MAALAGVELWHAAQSVMNRTSRLPPLSPSGIPWMATHVGFMGNLRPKTMDKAEIKEVRDARPRRRASAQAGFDIVYVYAGMGYLGYEFLLPNTITASTNTATDREPGALRARDDRGHQGRCRKDCGVALRVSLEELRGRPGRNQPSEAHELIELLADLPDLST